MSGITSINQFGSLTAQNGQRLKFEDFDKNGDGKISETEYREVLKENKLNTVNLSTVDTDGNKEISKDEFALWDQKQQMQEEVNALAPEIAIDFAGNKSKYIPELMKELKNYIEEFAKDYTGPVSNMAESFKSFLPGKYEEIKNTILSKDPSTVASNVVGEMLNNFMAEVNEKGKKKYSETDIKALSEALDKAANTFIKSYKGNNLKADLEAYLQDWLLKTDSEKLADDVSAYQSRIQRFGDTIESGELDGLKECARQLLQAALDKGIPVKLGEQSITNSSLLKTVLNKYTDGATLKNDVNVFISSLSKTNKLETTVSNGSSYQIDIESIDITSVTKDYGKEIYERGKGRGGSIEKAYAKGAEMLNSDALKSQIKAQLETILKAKGATFADIENVFENVYSQSVADTLDAEGMITSRGARGFGSKGKAWIDTTALVQKFVEVFNTNITSVIDKINASTSDLDVYDIDYSVMTKDKDGNLLVDEEVARALSTGNANDVAYIKKHGADYYKKQAEEMIDRLKPQMLAKAKAMCSANGIAFDENKFNIIFNNAKMNAVDISILERKELMQMGLYFRRASFRPQECVRLFVTEFQTNYTNWVKGTKTDKPEEEK